MLSLDRKLSSWSWQGEAIGHSLASKTRRTDVAALSDVSHRQTAHESSKLRTSEVGSFGAGRGL